MNRITAFIIDDESLARTRIRRLLENEQDINIAGECANGQEAVQHIKSNSPDLIFLDVQMPELNGFEVLNELGSEKLPVIIFVTAYDKYALKAFEVHAIDYLLKPFDDDRFYAALNHAREQIANVQNNSIRKKLFDLITDLTGVKSLPSGKTANEISQQNYLERLVIKTAGRIYFLKTNDIVRIKAAGKYLDILANEQEHIIRQTMNEIETKLNPDQFLRIHRSTILNIDQIKEMQHWYKSQYIFILNNGEKYTSGNKFRGNLESIIKRFS